MLVEIYSDVVCPWCYIGDRRFGRALGAYTDAAEVNVVYRPFQLDPSAPETPQPLKQQLEQKFGPQAESIVRRTAAVGKEEGLDLRFDEAQAVNTFTAHRLLRFALATGGAEVQRHLAERLFEAHFSRGANVADPEFLADLAEEVGLDRDAAAAYLTSGEGVQEVREEIATAQRLGIRAVPTFVFNGESAVQGAQPTSTFLKVLEDIGATTAENSQAEACADGACET